MNQQIQELLVKAGVINNNFNPLAYEQWYLDALEKFAELIVRECEKVAKDGPWYYDAPSCGWRKPINFVCKEMKEHFGVEE